MKAVAALVLAGWFGAASADELPIQVRRTTESGREVLIRGFAEFNGNCTLRHVQTITSHRRRTAASRRGRAR